MSAGDVLIIGGGVIGLSSAYRVAQRGLKVTVIDRGRGDGEASWASAGIIGPCSWHRRDELARMHMDAVMAYGEFAAEIQQHSGIDVRFNRCGRLQLLLDDNRMKMALNEVLAVSDRRTPEGQPMVSTLTPQDARVLEPHLGGEILGAQHCRLTARLCPPRLLEALRECGRNLGVNFRDGVEARSLLESGGRVIGVSTADEELHAGCTVLCAGCWSSALDPRLSCMVAVHPVRGQIILLHMEPVPAQRIIEVLEQHFYVVPRGDDHVVVGSTTEPDSGFVVRNTAEAVTGLCTKALHYLPVLGRAGVVRTWAGLRPGTPDGRPYMGFVPGLDGLLAATGHYRTGVITAPVMSMIVADLILSGHCGYDLESCRPGRTSQD